MKITCAGDYEEGLSIAVENVKSIRDFMMDNFTACAKRKAKLTLWCDNRERFKKMWGKQKFCWKGSEFRFWVWVHELEDCELVILSAKGKGTCYEYYITGDEKKAFKQIIEFMKGIK